MDDDRPKRVLDATKTPVLKRMKLSQLKKTFVSVPLEKYMKMSENDMENDPELEFWNGKHNEYLIFRLFHSCPNCRLHCPRNA